MEYTIDQIDDAIYYYLTCNNGKLFTSTQIYNGICNEKICVDLTKDFNKEANKLKFMNACHSLDSKYEDVTKRMTNGVLTLGFNCKTAIGLSEPEIFNTMFSCDDWSQSLGYGIDTFYDGNDTVIHLVCRRGNKRVLSKIMKTFEIDPHMKNNEGKTLIDVLPKDENGMAMLMDLMNCIKEKEVLALKTQLNVYNNTLAKWKYWTVCMTILSTALIAFNFI
jgi:hypothetical protein